MLASQFYHGNNPQLIVRGGQAHSRILSVLDTPVARPKPEFMALTSEPTIPNMEESNVDGLGSEAAAKVR